MNSNSRNQNMEKRCKSSLTAYRKYEIFIASGPNIKHMETTRNTVSPLNY